MSNDRMDVWEVDVDRLATSSDAASAVSPIRGRMGGSAPFEGCSHAKKAAERRQKEEVERFLSKERESGKPISTAASAFY